MCRARRLLQWLVSGPQLADVAVLIALYWVCLESEASSILVAVAVAEAGGSPLLALRWETQEFKYWFAVSGLAVAAAALGLMIRQRRELLVSLQEKAARLERERDTRPRWAPPPRACAHRSGDARHRLPQPDGHDRPCRRRPIRAGRLPAQASAAIERVSATGRQALTEMRDARGAAGRACHEPFSPQPTLERLDELIARVDAAGIPVAVDVDGDLQELAPGVQLAVFRVAPGGADQHAQARCATDEGGRQLRCTCGRGRAGRHNTGSGASVVRRRSGAASTLALDGRGLLGMRERANIYDGELDVGPTVTGDGGCICACKPAAAPPPDTGGCSMSVPCCWSTTRS